MKLPCPQHGGRPAPVGEGSQARRRDCEALRAISHGEFAPEFSDWGLPKFAKAVVWLSGSGGP